MSVKDQWVSPRKQVLNVLTAYRSYGIGNPSSLSSTDGGFTPTASMAILGEKLGTDPRIGQLSCYGLGKEQ
jgi:hypothetical protein